jgi:hypothetical protein
VWYFEAKNMAQLKSFAASGIPLPTLQKDIATPLLTYRMPLLQGAIHVVF